MGLLNWWRNVKFVNIDLIISENIALLKTVGFWTGERKLSSRTIIIVSWMMCILPFYMVIPQLMFIPHANSIKLIIEWLCPFSSILLTHIKMLFCNRKRNELEDVIYELQENWDKYTTSEDKQTQQILAEAKKFCRSLTIMYTALFSIICINYALLPIFKYIFLLTFYGVPDDYLMNFPYAAVFLYDYETNRVIFTVTYCATMVVVYILAMSLSGFDTSFITLSYHVTAQFKLLNLKIGRINVLINDQDNSSTGMRNLTLELNEVVKDHNKCIILTEKLENIFNTYLMIQFLSSSIIVCIVFYQLQTGIGLNDNTFRMVAYAFGAVLQLYIFCWASEQIKFEAGTIADAAYNIQWYSCPIAIQKTNKLIMLRAQKPVGVTAAKFYMISLQTFQAIIYTSYSYFTLLQTVTTTQ